MKQCDDCGSYYSEGRSYCPCCGVANDEYDEANWGYYRAKDEYDEDYWGYDNEDYWCFDDEYNEEYDNEEEF